MAKKVTRLYSQFQPTHYTIDLKPDRDSLTFTGIVIIKGKKVGPPSKRIVFHEKELKISTARITKHEKSKTTEFPIERINLLKSADEVRLHSSQMLYAGEYTIELEFNGKISRQMNGMYPCYFKHHGQDKMLIATQFESHHAREVFPCIDEPEAKAVFNLTLTTPKAETVIANTPIKTQKTERNSLITNFEETPKMSTYLLAFIYGELEFSESKTANGTAVRVYATPDNVDYTKFALECAVKTLDFYNDYFDVPYPLPKCDFIALPDFASGAMENWGCITFREQALLVDPKNTSLHLKQYVANVVAHELTHQWFGNLVTMRWWSDLWLNESFASWMSYLAVDHLFPDWKVWVQFIVDEQGYALKQDALANTHPIQVTINHPDEIRTIFDAISYEKGASVLLMLYTYLGADSFREGLRYYLKEHAYGNTDTTDLWKALEKHSDLPVTEFMEAWTSISGYPIVETTIVDSKIEISQERFYLNPAAQKESAVWPIPLSPNLKLDKLELTNNKQTFTQSEKSDEVLIINHGRPSFYRTIYASDHLAKLAQAIEAGKVSDLDRLGILNDSFESAKAGYSKTTDSLALLSAYAHESSPLVWDVIAGGLGSIRTAMNSDSIRKNMKPFARKLAAEQLKRLGWVERKNDSHFDLLLRPTILALASYGEEPSVVAEAKRLFKSMKTPEDIDPDIRGVVYGTVSRDGDTAEFKKLHKMHNTSPSSEERVTLAAALTNFKSPELIAESLKLITSDDVRLQDVSYWVAYSFMNYHARKATWEWLKENWEWLKENLGGDLSFYRMPLYAARGFSDKKILPEFTEFFTSRMSPAFERPVNQGIETIQWQSAWRVRDLEGIEQYFKN